MKIHQPFLTGGRNVHMNRRFTTILWDVDNTLLDFDYSCRGALKQGFYTMGIEITEEMIERYFQINDGYWKRFEKGEVTKEQVLNNRFADFFKEYDLLDYPQVSVQAFRQEYQKNLVNIYSYLDDSLTICKALQTKFKQYIVTNGVASTQRSKIGLSGFSEVMEDLFISEEIGAPKPHAEFFENCLSKIEEKNRSKILLVGDSLSSDIKGANMAGIKACWYNPKEKELPAEYSVDYEITDLHQVYEILGIFDKKR